MGQSFSDCFKDCIDRIFGSDCRETRDYSRCPSHNHRCSFDISTPDLLYHLPDETSFSFNLHQNVITSTIDIVEDFSSASASASASGVSVPERWIKHYCSSHKVLLVGEGDFSFSASLAAAFGSAANMVATSLDSRGFLFRNYKRAMSNIHQLRSRGCRVMHDVDVTEMANYGSLTGIKYDRIIFNFPHAGFCSDEPEQSAKRRHQLLITLFFDNAKKMIDEDGEIHVTHKFNAFFLGWNLKGLAAAVGLRLVEELPFDFSDYPGYRTKYGFGGDRNFNSNPSKTYKFGLLPLTSSSSSSSSSY